MRFRSVVVLAVAVVMVAWMLMASESARAGWQAQESGVRLPLLAVAFGDSAHGYVTTGIDDMYDHILATSDGGVTWGRSYSAPYGLRAVTCIGNKGVIAVGDEGTIVSSPLPGVAGARGQRVGLGMVGTH